MPVTPFGFQSTHPVWDATIGNNVSIIVIIDFNPRIPYGMRRASRLPFRHQSKISIHASRMGCDALHLRENAHMSDFNPRIPYGMRRDRAARAAGAESDFNPRIPYGMRQERQGYRDGRVYISIHASRMGCDGR